MVLLRTILPKDLASVRVASDPVNPQVLASAGDILNDIRTNGYTAVVKHAVRLKDIPNDSSPLIISPSELKESFDSLPSDQQSLLIRVANRIRKFAEKQRKSVSEFSMEVPGGEALQKVAPVAKAGCYAPGGRFPLPSSVLMTALTAKVAGVSNVIVASPRPAEVTKAAAHVAGANGLLCIGGAQAIGVLAYGCPNIGISPVDVIVGPGNAWVTAAKKIVSGLVGIDMLAGPSELLVLADGTADPSIIAADLLAQAEHDIVALPILVTPDKDLISQVNKELEIQLETLPTKATASESIKNGYAVLVPDLETGVKITNEIAPEHLELLVRDLERYEHQLENYGALFVGSYAAEVLGDYGIGPNHTLPTSSTSRSHGGLSVFNFLRIRTVLKIPSDDRLKTKEGRQVVEDSIALAKLEGLIAHSRSAEKRLFISSNDEKDFDNDYDELDVLDLVRPEFRSLEEYSPIEPLEKIAQRYNLDPMKIAKLDGNENLYGMTSQVRETLTSSLDKYNIYPDPFMTELRTAIGEFHQVHPDNIICGAGSDEILDLVIRLFAPSCVISCPPTFGMYKFLSDVNVTRFVEVPRTPFPDFSIKVDDIISTIQGHEGTKVLFLASPNNPTGNKISSCDVELLCKEKSCVVVMDEAYMDFSDDVHGSIDIFAKGKFPNLIVLRTFSKWAGLAGLRIGYGIMDSRIAHRMMQIKQPYNVNVAASVAAKTCLVQRENILPQIEGMKRERSRMISQLGQFGWIEPIPSEANFVLCKLQDFPSRILQSTLRQSGVFSRCYASKQGTGLLDNFIRFSCGRPVDTDLVLSSLANFDGTSSYGKSIGEHCRLLRSEAKLTAILFDMDGVLADVSRSYREAIIQTAGKYGVVITMSDIDRMKNQGNANNDWILTLKLLKQAGVDAVDLQEVTSVFQMFYESGLRDTEALMCSPEFLSKLRSSYRMAIVTGRPRKEAEYFLKLHKIADYFEVLVCMEDTPHPKPHPDPVLKALDELGIDSKVEESNNTYSLFIGDTIDDILAAVRTNRRVVPIGIGTKHMTHLFKAGAPRVIGHLHELEDILGTTTPKSLVVKTGRVGSVQRVTKETSISVKVDLDGSGKSRIETGIGFFDHMLESLSKHSRVDIDLVCKGDLHIDDHHSVEDTALALGEAIFQALGSRAGIARFGSAMAPLDEALARAVVDLSGRPHCSANLELQREKVGDLSTEMVSHFFQSFAVSCKCTIHLDVLRGENHHHKVEASFKAFALALRLAISGSAFKDIPSTKGVL